MDFLYIIGFVALGAVVWAWLTSADGLDVRGSLPIPPLPDWDDDLDEDNNNTQDEHNTGAEQMKNETESKDLAVAVQKAREYVEKISQRRWVVGKLRKGSPRPSREALRALTTLIDHTEKTGLWVECETVTTNGTIGVKIRPVPFQDGPPSPYWAEVHIDEDCRRNGVRCWVYEDLGEQAWGEQRTEHLADITFDGGNPRLVVALVEFVYTMCHRFSIPDR